jgi:hypothetical protein
MGWQMSISKIVVQDPEQFNCIFWDCQEWILARGYPVQTMINYDSNYPQLPNPREWIWWNKEDIDINEYVWFFPERLADLAMLFKLTFGGK